MFLHKTGIKNLKAGRSLLDSFIKSTNAKVRFRSVYQTSKYYDDGVWYMIDVQAICFLLNLCVFFSYLGVE